MEFRIARAARVTGQMLEEGVRAVLAEQKIKEPDCVVCYGVGYTGRLPVLNARCSADKLDQAFTLQGELKHEALDIIIPDDPGPNAVVFAALAHPKPAWIARRKLHSKGRDIRVCTTCHGVRAALKNHDYFTPLVESDTEYRAWVYRRRVLAVYEKRLTEPEKNKKFGRNRANGWTFHALNSDNIPESVRRVAVQAVRALDLDFGAVDILGKRDRDGQDVKATVLEVNSAPGVSDEHRTAIVKLKNRIVRWIANGCPARGET